MADIVTIARAKNNAGLASMSDGDLGVLIAAASAAIHKKYTVGTEEEVQEACVQLMLHFKQEASAGTTERLGDYSYSALSGGSDQGKFPYLVTLLLRDYKTPKTGPVVVPITDD